MERWLAQYYAMPGVENRRSAIGWVGNSGVRVLPQRHWHSSWTWLMYVPYSQEWRKIMEPPSAFWSKMDSIYRGKECGFRMRGGKRSRSLFGFDGRRIRIKCILRLRSRL